MAKGWKENLCYCGELKSDKFGIAVMRGQRWTEV